jgi:hypothetical protein
MDIIYSWDNNCIRVVPHGRFDANARCIPLRGAQPRLSHTGEPIYKRGQLVMEKGGRGLSHQEILDIVQQNYAAGNQSFKLNDFYYLSEGQGYIPSQSHKPLEVQVQNDLCD